MKPVVLMIDDDPQILKATRRMLEGRDWDVLTACDPAEAAAYYPVVDVVLSDWDMPEGGGARVLAESPVPVVVHTGRPEAVRLEHPGAHIVAKPSELSTIEGALRRAMATVASVRTSRKGVVS